MEWRDINGSAYYQVSNRGLIRNKRTGRILRTTSNGKGVLKVILSEDGDHVSKSVARLVGEEFVDGYEPGFVIFYVDGSSENVDASNLLWKPRWFAQEWSYQLRRNRPMRPWPIRMNSTGEVYENSLECALATLAIEKYIVLACIQGDTIYNKSTYDWIKK